MNNNFCKELNISYKKEIFRKILLKIQGIQNDDEQLTFFVREINNDINNNFILEHYDYLRKHFKLPHHSRTPKKLTSQTLLSMFKECDLQYKKSTKSFNMLREGKKFKTTSGFYIVVV